MWQLLLQQQRQQKEDGGKVIDVQDKTRNAAAVILWRAQEIEVEGQIYDKMRDGDVNSSRRQEVCERAVASIRLRLQLLD